MSPDKAASARPPAGLFWPAWIAFAVVVLLIDLMNVQSAVRDGVRPGWLPALWEYSSGAVDIVLFPLIWRAARWAWPGDGRPLRFFLAQACFSLTFSLVHVAGFVLLRDGIYALLGARYYYDWRGFPYEYPRDLIAYGLSVGGIWGMTRLMNTRAADLPPPAPGAAATFDIRDGARTLRVPLSDIAAVSSAGNYVEFNLVDCRKPLMRGTLGAMERQFAPRGFVRIHRSWLVNPERVEAIEPAGSGDFTVTLVGGVKAPLSRRFREALEALRG